MISIEKELQEIMQGEVHFDILTRQIYSVDASIFEILPIGVVLPKTKEELQNIVKIAAKHKVPITVRGAATGITGGCLGNGLIIDLSKYFRQILELNLEKQFVICEPGVIQDDLNRYLAPHGFRLGPDTSTGNRATLGGMLANNAAGARSLHYGKMVDHVEAVELLLSSGEFIKFNALSEEEFQTKCLKNDKEGQIYQTIASIQTKDKEEIIKRFPNIPRRVSGYNLDELIKSGPLNLAKLIAGSEGTLGIATAIQMKIVPIPEKTALFIFSFDALADAFKKVPELLTFFPFSLELIDEQIISLGRSSPLLRGKIEWLKGTPKALLVLEIGQAKISLIEEKYKEALLLTNSETIGYVWELRKAGLGILLSKRSYSRAIAFIEDLSLPPHRLADFMKKFCAYLSQAGKQSGIYGHAGAGCMHIRPYIDLRDPAEIQFMRQMMEDISTMVLAFEGSLSGEHGDGWIRSWLNPKMFGEQLMHSFQQVKEAFDPTNLMNPGKIIPTIPPPFESLRNNVNETLKEPETFLDFSQEGGFALAADLCNGNGACRKSEGVMCPSFQATKDEFHSTRARAQALRSLIHHRDSSNSMTNEGLHEVMDLCLSCKGCKTECPSQIDMAKFKSEFLYHYQEIHGYSLRNRLFGNIGKIYRWISIFPKFFNWSNESKLGKFIFDKIGITTKRSFPKLSTQKFSELFKEKKVIDDEKKTVVLFNDTFTEFLHPEIGEAAVKVLERLGFHVVVPQWRCCGRPALSKGLLKEAKAQALQLIEMLFPFAEQGIPLIGLEPSCLLTIKDDYASLVGSKQTECVINHCVTFDEFIEKQIETPKWNFPPFPCSVKVHGHCYQKSLSGMEKTLRILKSIAGVTVNEIPSGCCGMAGSFGYEEEHVAISMKIGELVLFPAIRKNKEQTMIIANGTSCRQQIMDGTGEKALHLAEVLEALILKNK